MESNEKKLKNDEDTKKYIYRPWITKNGQKIYAKTYGLKAFKIQVQN